MKRRQVLKWATPVVIGVVLPAHAATTDDGFIITKVTTTQKPTTTVKPEPTKPPVTTLPPVTTTPEPPCKQSHKVEICHREPKKHDVTICVDKHSVKKHVKLHNDYLGKCK